jgi:archaellum component FlaC
MGYLGKISAVVGVSTGDFESKLNRCANEVTKFSNKVVRSLAASSGQTGASFDQMYTKAQRFERMLRAATSGKLDFAGLKNFPGKTLEEAADSMRKMESVAFSMTAPIAQIAKQTEAMSVSMREAFAPALIKAQAEAERLRDKLETVGQTVTQGEILEGERQVERLADAYKNLGEAAQMASKLSSGKGFRFSQPGAHDELSRASAADAKVNALPAHQMTPSLVALVQEQKAAADAVAQYNAALQASPSAEAQGALNARVASLRDVTEEINRQIAAYDKLDTQAATIKRTTAAFEELRSSAAFALSGLPQNLDQAKAKYDQIVASISRLSDEQKKAFAAGTSGGHAVDSLAGAVTSEKKSQLPKALKLIKEISDQIDGMHKMDVGAKEAAAETERLQQSLEKIISTYSEMGQDARFAFTGQAQSIKQASQQRQQILSQVGSMAPASRAFASAKLEDLDNQARAMISSGNKDQLPDINDHLDKMKQVVADQIAADAAMKDTADDASRLKKELESAASAAQKNADALNRAFTGQAQNVDQVSSSYGTLISRIEKLTDVQRMQLQARHGSDLADVGHSIAFPEGPNGAMSAGQISSANAGLAYAGASVTKFEQDNKDLDDRTAKATAFNKQLAKITDSIGTPAAPIDAFDAAVQKATADVAKMKDATKKSQAERFLNKLKSDSVALAAASGSPASKDADIAKLTRRAGRIATFANQRTAAGVFGSEIGSADQQIASLEADVKQTLAVIEKLPIPIQRVLGPAIDAVKDKVVALTAASTLSEREAARVSADALKKTVGNHKTSQDFSGTFGEFLDEAAPKAYKSQLDSIQQRFMSLGAVVGGPTAKAIDNYEKALHDASQTGVLGTKQTRDQMESLTVSIAKAAVAEKLLNNGQAKSFLVGLKKNFGDVGRGGADKFALAMNQAAYAVDDWMSATGGIEQKIRAISNNLTQLGFVAGGNTGLYLALASVITSHVVIAYMKFAEGGKTAEDKSKALNDALDKQKDGVGKLSAAYADLAKEMSKSENASKGIARADMIGKIDDLRRSNSNRRSGDLAEGVLSESALQASLERKLKNATTAGQAVSIQMALESSRGRERSARNAASSSVPLVDESKIDALRAFRAQRTNELTNSFQASFRDATGFDFGNKARLQRIQGEKDVAAVDAIIKKFEDSVSAASDKLAENIVTASLSASDKIDAAQSDVADAIGRGVKGAAAFQVELDAAGRALSNAMMAMHDAAMESNPAKKAEATERAQRQYDNAVRDSASFADRSAALRRQRGMAGEGSSLAVDVAARDEIAARRAYNDAAKNASAVNALADKNAREAGQRVQDAIKAQKTAEEDLAAKEAHLRLNPRDENNPFNPPGLTKDEQKVEDAKKQVELARAAVKAAREEKMQAISSGAVNSFDANEEARKAAKSFEDAQSRADEAKSRQEGVQRERERAKAGLDLARSEKERRVKSATTDAELVGAAAAEMANPQKFLQGYFDNKKKEVQTALKGYEDERQNALTGGPSRAALNATDVTSAGGSSELNRLLRGDDASKDVNFAEMKHQSELLAEIRDGIRDATGIIVN